MPLKEDFSSEKHSHSDSNIKTEKNSCIDNILCKNYKKKYDEIVPEILVPRKCVARAFLLKANKKGNEENEFQEIDEVMNAIHKYALKYDLNPQAQKIFNNSFWNEAFDLQKTYVEFDYLPSKYYYNDPDYPTVGLLKDKRCKYALIWLASNKLHDYYQAVNRNQKERIIAGNFNLKIHFKELTAKLDLRRKLEYEDNYEVRNGQVKKIASTGLKGVDLGKSIEQEYSEDENSNAFLDGNYDKIVHYDESSFGLEDLPPCDDLVINYTNIDQRTGIARSGKNAFRYDGSGKNHVPLIKEKYKIIKFPQQENFFVG